MARAEYIYVVHSGIRVIGAYTVKYELLDDKQEILDDYPMARVTRVRRNVARGLPESLESFQ